jgi:hypothetical protein
MEFMPQIFIVFAVLLVVVVAALTFEPGNPYEAWLKLAQRYATERRPTAIQFTDQHLMFGHKRVKRLNDFARFDTAIDDFGLWIIYRNNDQEEVPDALKIPGTHVRFEAHHGQQYLFQLYADPPVRMTAKGEFGETLMNKVKGDESAA